MPGYIELTIESFKEIFTYLTAHSKSKDIIKNAVLREMRDNMKLLEHRNMQNVNTAAIIEAISAAAIEDAYKQNYNFNKLAHIKTLPAGLILNKRQQDYIGWDCKRFIYSIEGKIKDVKNLPKLYPDLKAAPVNLTLRLDNLFYQIVLLTLFIRKTES